MGPTRHRSDGPSVDRGRASRSTSHAAYPPSLASTSTQQPCRDSSRPRARRTRRAHQSWSTVAAVLVSSILVTSPLVMSTANAMPSPQRQGIAQKDVSSQSPYGIGSTQPSTHFKATSPLHQSTFDSSAIRADSEAHVSHRCSNAQSSSCSSSTMDDVDSHLPSYHLLRRYAEGEDTPSDLFDPSGVPASSSDPAKSALLHARAPSAVRRYALPSSYPSSIASSWSRPERSVWFQSKAIIITSCFLAIFIILFIGAAVFLRERKLDDELAGLDDDEALARLDERMTGGARGGSEKDGKSKRRFRLGRSKNDKEMKQVDSSDPSTGSSSAVRRRRHIVSRWTKRSSRDSRDTLHASDDAASVRSARSSRRAALGDPTAPERVEITYDGGRSLQPSNSDGTRGSGNRPRSPPPPHTHSATGDVRGEQSASTASDSQSPTSSGPRRHAAFDDSDFHAAELAETHDDARHMPPAYIPSGPAGSSSAAANHTLVADAMARGDSKHGIPAPAERDQTVTADVIRAAFDNDVAQQSGPDPEVGTASAHIATDDKVMLGALTAAASQPSAPSAPGTHVEMSAPAYAAPSRASNHADGQQGPSAPTLEVDEDGFEMASHEAQGASASAPMATAPTPESAAGKGKARQGLSLLPAPPQAVESAFSPFDQPYRTAASHAADLPRSRPSTPGRASIPTPTERTASPLVQQGPTAQKSEKQKEADDELAQLVASRPAALDVPRYEQHGSLSAASAPPLAHDEYDAASVPVPLPSRLESLPAYERNNGAPAPAASAPPPDEDAPNDEHASQPS